MRMREIYKEVSQCTGICESDVQATIHAFCDILKERMVKGEDIDLSYFGVFTNKYYSGKRLPHFKPSRDLCLILKYNL